MVTIPQPRTHQGVVCSMKNLFGFIERSDLVREIFFHYSEFKGDINELELGDDVEFKITQRNVSLNNIPFHSGGTVPHILLRWSTISRLVSMAAIGKDGYDITHSTQRYRGMQLYSIELQHRDPASVPLSGCILLNICHFCIGLDSHLYRSDHEIRKIKVTEKYS